MERLLLALVIMVVAVAVAEVLRRRRRPDAPTQPRYEVPSQVDRADFVGDGWLVAVFTSETCSTCADVVRKAEVLRSAEVAVEVATFQQRRDLHERYAIEAVPALLVADRDGVVHASFLGPMTATDLWAAVADAREPGSIDRSEGCESHRHD
jgi:hypothetical protein